MDTVKDLQKRIFEIKKAHKENRDKADELKYKRAYVEERMPGLKEAIVSAEAKKDRILQMHVSDEASAQEVDDARNAIKTTQKAADEAHEFISAAVKRLNGLDSEYARLGSEHAQTIKDLWLAGYEEIKLELATIKGLREKVRRAFIMSNLGQGGGGSFGIILQDLLGGLPGSDELTQLRTTLEKEFLEGGPKNENK